MHFFNIVQRALDPASLTFEHLVDFFDRLGGTLHCSKIGQNKAKIWEKYVNYTLKS